MIIIHNVKAAKQGPATLIVDSNSMPQLGAKVEINPYSSI